MNFQFRQSTSLRAYEVPDDPFRREYTAKDFFSVNPHKRHLCAGCGRHFGDKQVSVGNPLMALKNFVGDKDINRPTKKPGRAIDIDQKRFKYGIELWGSNPAILWTADRLEEEGIHVHCYDNKKMMPDIDETFDHVTIDGQQIDAYQLRVLMAQLALPHLTGRVVTLFCPSCSKPHMEIGTLAHSPHPTHICEHCGFEFPSKGRLRNVVSNPMLETLAVLETKSPLPRKPFLSPFLIEH